MNNPEPEIFWSWFNDNQQSLRDGFMDTCIPSPGDDHQALMERAQALMEQIFAAVQKYDERLFPFGGIASDGKMELIITAEGQAEAFDSVRSLIANAPDNEDWRFIALKPLADMAGGIATADGSVEFNSLSFALVNSQRTEGTLNLLVILDSDELEVTDAEGFATINLLESILGEEDLTLRIDDLQIGTSAQVTEQTGGSIKTSPISELAGEFDSLIAAMPSN